MLFTLQFDQMLSCDGDFVQLIAVADDVGKVGFCLFGIAHIAVDESLQHGDIHAAEHMFGGMPRRISNALECSPHL